MQNIDSEEISKFEKLAESWWDQNGELRTLHAINTIRMQFIQNTVELHDQKIVDIGCGGGILAESLAKQGAIVTGIDMAEAALTVARSHSQENHLTIDYQLITAEELAAQKTACYDVITCMELLEHVPDPISVLNACAHLLKPNGSLFISTINRHWKAYLFAIIGAEYALGLLPKGTHDYAKLIKPSELERWMREQGLMTKDIKGLVYHPFSHDFKLSHDVDINYIVHAKKS